MIEENVVQEERVPIEYTLDPEFEDLSELIEARGGASKWPEQRRFARGCAPERPVSLWREDEERRLQSGKGATAD